MGDFYRKKDAIEARHFDGSYQSGLAIIQWMAQHWDQQRVPLPTLDQTDTPRILVPHRHRLPDAAQGAVFAIPTGHWVLRNHRVFSGCAPQFFELEYMQAPSPATDLVPAPGAPLPKDLVAEIAMDIGKEVASYIETMYPNAVKATSSTFLTSLRNCTHNEIMAMINVGDERAIRDRLTWRKKFRREQRAIYRKIRNDSAANIAAADRAMAEKMLNDYGIVTAPWNRDGGEHPMLMHILRLITDVRSEAREHAAAIADMWATENFRLAGDTVLTDPFLSGRDRSAAAFATSEKLMVEGHGYATAAHAAQHIAHDIRANEQPKEGFFDI